ncbi:MAG: hypothetical protein GW854_13740 [Erythrobacter sp.]|nr:hypothetical protein [Erythrobacter sp.]
MNSPLMSVREVGKYLGYSGKTAGRSSIFAHLKHKRLRKVKIRGRTFVTKDSADALILENIV